MSSLNLNAELGSLRAFKEFVCQFLVQCRLSEERIDELELAVEELLVNIISYSYQQAGGDIEINCEKEGGFLKITIIDEGMPFDPTQQAEPDLDAPLEQREQGGMGIFLVQNLVDELTYKRKDNKNRLTLRVKAS